MRLLLVEDDADVVDTLVFYLQREGYVVDVAATLDVAREALRTGPIDLVILDRMLPDGDGLSLVEYAKKHRLPQRFLVLTALAGIDDTVTGLDLGAVDYLGKPFEPRELLARIRNAMRQSLDQPEQVRRFGPLTEDVRLGAFFIDGEPFVLRRTEALVLSALMSRAGVPITREAIEMQVYGYDRFVQGNALESQMSRLRGHLARQTGAVRIQAVRGLGYRLVLE